MKLEVIKKTQLKYQVTGNLFMLVNILSFLEDEFLSKLFQNPNGNPLYKKCIIILQSVKETIHDQMGPNISSTAYDTAFFATLFNLIKQIIQRDNYENIDSTLFLFNYAFSKVNPGIIQKTSNEVVDSLNKIAIKTTKSIYAPKYIIQIFQCILQTKTQKDW